MFRTLDRSIDKACEAYARTRRLQAAVRAERLAGEILATGLPASEWPSLPQWSAFVAAQAEAEA